MGKNCNNFVCTAYTIQKWHLIPQRQKPSIVIFATYLKTESTNIKRNYNYIGTYISQWLLQDVNDDDDDDVHDKNRVTRIGLNNILHFQRERWQHYNIRVC